MAASSAAATATAAALVRPSPTLAGNNDTTLGAALRRALLSRNTLAQAVSGSFASCVAMAMLYPLDKARMVAQTAPAGRKLGVVEAFRTVLDGPLGWRGLYAGLYSTLVSLGTSNLVYFYWSAALKALVQAARRPADRSQELATVWNLLIAFVAGCINVVLTTPMWVATTRIALMDKTGERFDGFWDAISSIAHKEGVGALFNGLLPSLVLVTNPTIQFVSYDRVKTFVLAHMHDRGRNADALFALDAIDDALLESGTAPPNPDEAVEFVTETAPQLTAFEAFVVGGFAKFVATIATYPLQLAQTRLRARKSVAQQQPQPMSQSQSQSQSQSTGQQPPPRTPIAMRTSVPPSPRAATAPAEEEVVLPVKPASAPASSTSTSGQAPSTPPPRQTPSQTPTSSQPETMLQCLQHIYLHEGGIVGLYAGLSTKLFQTVANSALMFLVLEKLSQAVYLMLLRRKLTKAAAR